jgi:hypothetical protein
VKYLTALLSILTILSLDLIIFLGAPEHALQSVQPVFNGLVAVMDLSLVSSSALLGLIFMRHGARVLGAVFLLNVVIFVAASILVGSGVRFSRELLFGMDIYWLNLYLIGATKCFQILFSPRP